jgi:hypothetical protein
MREMKENIWYFYGVAYETEDDDFNDFISAYYILKNQKIKKTTKQNSKNNQDF